MIISGGLFGGFINCVLFDKVLRFPSKEFDSHHRPIYMLGSLGPILLGVAASLLAWGFGVGQMNNFKNELALLFLSGIGGGSFITNLMQKQQIGIQKQQIGIQNQQINVEKVKSTAAIHVAKATVNQLREVRQKASEKKRTLRSRATIHTQTRR